MPQPNKNTAKKPRKEPRQQRSIRTVQAILSAAAHILKRHGPAGFTTNHVAQQANISVGSIYQYFPNKHAILMRLMTAQLEQASAQRPPSLDSANAINLEERIRTSVRWHLAVRRQDPLLFQRLYEIQRDVLSSEERASFDRYHQDAVHAGLQHHREEIQIIDLKMAALIVSQFLLAATQAATAAQPKLLQDTEYENQITRAVLSYLR